MSDLTPQVIIPPADASSDALDFAALDPLGITRSAPGVQPRTANRAWYDLMQVLGRKVPGHLGVAVGYRNAMLSLTRRGSRLR